MNIAMFGEWNSSTSKEESEIFMEAYDSLPQLLRDYVKEHNNLGRVLSYFRICGDAADTVKMIDEAANF